MFLMPLTLALIEYWLYVLTRRSHFRRAEPGLLPDHGHDWNSDLRKDIGRHRADCGDAEEENESC
jgi:hypothetical protein